MNRVGMAPDKFLNGHTVSPKKIFEILCSYQSKHILVQKKVYEKHTKKNGILYEFYTFFFYFVLLFLKK